MTLLYTQFLVLQEAVNNRSPSPFYLPLNFAASEPGCPCPPGAGGREW